MTHDRIRLSKSKKTTKKGSHRKPPTTQRDAAANKKFERKHQQQRRMCKQGVPEAFLFRGRWYKVIATYTNRRLAMRHARDWREEEHSGAAVKMYESPSGKVYAFGVAYRR